VCEYETLGTDGVERDLTMIPLNGAVEFYDGPDAADLARREARDLLKAADFYERVGA
jgi:hypothetical protein